MTGPRTDVEAQSIRSVYVFSFIIRRCYPNLYARIANRKNIWGEHPIRIIHQWYQSATARSSLHSKTFDLSGVPVTQLVSFGLHPTSPSSARYEVSPQNVRQWCDLLLRLLDNLEAAFPTVKNSRRSRPVPTPPARSIKAADDVMGVMGLLNDLLVGDVVDHLIKRELEYHLSQAYDRTMSTSWTGESRLSIVASSV